MYLNIASNGSDNLASNAGIVQDTLRGDNGVSGANLRGQGSDATLVLLNGRRVATHGLKGRAVDLNSIPFAAIERVEVLRDGASAIYGTDAIGGVINFITKRDYQGAQVTGFVDVTEEGGGNVYRSSLLFGHGDLDKDGWNAFGTLSVKRNTILRGDDRDFSNTFQPDRGLSPDTRGTPFATVFSLGTSGVGSTSLLKGGVFGARQCHPPHRGQHLQPAGRRGLRGRRTEHGSLYAYRSWNSLSSKYACAWDYPAAAVIQQPVDSVDFIGRATFRIGEQHEAYVELTGSKVKVAKTFEPNQISPAPAPPRRRSARTTWYPLNATTKATYDKVTTRWPPTSAPASSTTARRSPTAGAAWPAARARSRPPRTPTASSPASAACSATGPRRRPVARRASRSRSSAPASITPMRSRRRSAAA